MSLLSRATRTYTSFGGVDIFVAFDDRSVDTLQGITISITREKAPVYIMGTVHPMSITRGKRGIAGTMSFVHFDREPLNYLMTDREHYYYAHADEVNWLTDALQNPNTPLQYDEDGALIINSQSVDTNTSFGVSVRSAPMFLDQVMPFDATLIAANEYGNGAWSSILGMEVINEGSGLSTDDLSHMITATYLAMTRIPWSAIGSGGRTYDSYKANRVSAQDAINGDPTVTLTGQQP